MERITQEADFGLEDWEETLFFVKSDPNGAYDILDIAKHQGEPEFDEILKNVSLRLAGIENILGDDYDIDRLRELVQADKEGRIRILSAGKGKSCGTCANFQPVPGHKCGDCKARKYFRASQSRRACSMYIGKDK
ncbi:MAG TPA: hypothetical protein H9739_09930 [Candidatus Agathobaculum pullistercoris]|nr:hypothetical protein [uncultured Agathobaculum sp.]HIX11887.1 hypothetical protein [Candidatus Agathobaculum pullistercoris]